MQLNLDSLLTALSAACISLVFIESGIPHWVKVRLWGRNAYKRRLKPFDCHLCLAWWVGIALNYFGTETHFSIYTCGQSALVGAIAGITAVLLNKYINEFHT